MRIMSIITGIAALIPPAVLAASVQASPSVNLVIGFPYTFTIGAAFFLCCIAYLVAAGMREEKENKYAEAE